MVPFLMRLQMLVLAVEERAGACLWIDYLDIQYEMIPLDM